MSKSIRSSRTYSPTREGIFAMFCDCVDVETGCGWLDWSYDHQAGYELLLAIIDSINAASSDQVLSIYKAVKTAFNGKECE